MKTYRLDQLADGIFAILMTLLAFDIHLPILSGRVTDVSLWYSFAEMSDVFLISFISFALLFTYWRSHHFIVSTYAKNMTAGLANYNALFFFFVSLIPFSSRFLVDYQNNRVPIIFYGMNIIFIGLTLYFMRRYVEISPTINTVNLPQDQVLGGYIRILFPVFSALLAVVLCLWNPEISLVLFAIATVFNLIPGVTTSIARIIVGTKKKR